MEDRAAPCGHWEHFPHGADVGVRGVGASKEEAFEQAALGLTAVITDPITVACGECIELSCDAVDDELLLVSWLNAVIYEMAVRRMLFGHFHVHIEKRALRAKAWGETMDPFKHELAIEVKGATCTEVAVKRNSNGNWIAQCVLDV